MWCFSSKGWFQSARREAVFEAETKAGASWYGFDHNLLPGSKALRKNLLITKIVLVRRKEDHLLYLYRLLLLGRLSRVNQKIMEVLHLPDEEASNWRLAAQKRLGLNAEDRQHADMLYRKRKGFIFKLRGLRCPFRDHSLCGPMKLPWEEPQTI